MPEGQPDPEQQHPDDVADQGPGPGGWLFDDRPAERPQRVRRDAQRREAKRNGDDEQEADKRRQQVPEGQPEATEHQPDNVQD